VHLRIYLITHLPLSIRSLFFFFQYLHINYGNKMVQITFIKLYKSSLLMLLISAQKWYISCVILGILVTCFARLSMKKLQFYASMPFMLYVPNSTLFVQKNTSKDQKINQSCKTISLKQDSSRLSEKTAESNCQSRLQLA